jgi:hypothetical protein
MYEIGSIQVRKAGDTWRLLIEQPSGEYRESASFSSRQELIAGMTSELQRRDVYPRIELPFPVSD